MSKRKKNDNPLISRKTYYLPKDAAVWLETIAKQEGRSASNYLAMMLLKEAHANSKN